MGVSSFGAWFSAGVLIVVGYFVTSSCGHGRLIEPPSRSTMWRYGFSTQPNYNDHELYCGGLSRQIRNKGKCGVCGDPWDVPQPRANEAGGKYGTGTIVRKYTSGENVRIKVELTANHKGFFEFRICPNNNPKRIVTQTCLDKYILRQSDGSGGTRYNPPGGENRVFEIRYQLPVGLTCTQCVFQWRYVAGNNWGNCPNGTQGMGCGSQEEFRACADIAIADKSGTSDSTESTDIDTDINEVDPIINIDVTNDVDDKDDNEVSKDYKSYGDRGGHDSFYIGFIIAAAGLVFAILLLAAVILYFSRGRELLKEMLRKTSSSGKSQQYDVPHNGTVNNKEPERPPRGLRKQLSLPDSLQNGKLTANNISSPTAVTINGISLKSDMNSFPPPV